jgi:RNA polymerase sigma-70 factor, ECF subfamily
VNVADGHPDDLDLVRRCLANEPGAFEALYQAHASRLFALAIRLVGREQAEDLLQDIFVTAHTKLSQFRGDSSLGTWLFRLGTNTCLDYLRSRAGRTTRLADTIEMDVDAGGHAGPILGVIDRLDLERAAAELPAGARAVFVLHDVEGLDHREVASLIGVAEGTSKSQLHKARLKLRVALAGSAVVRQAP